jgi:hypothetical protein
MFAKLLVKAVLYAIALIWLIPALGIGVTVHGGFGVALGLALGFSVVSWLVTLLVEAVIVGTLGLAGCLYVFVWWLMPALCLHFTADLFPANLTIASTGSAIAGGLVLMVMSLVAQALVTKRSTN